MRFASGAQTATLRFTPVDNGDRTQPAISIGAGTPTTAGGITLGEVTGAPVVFSIVDDETPKATVTFSVSDLRLLENGSATYTVVLDQEPTAGMANLEVAKVDANTASFVSDARWSIVAGYYDSNANRPPNYGANWYRVLIAYRRDRGDRTMPAWAGQTAEPATAYTEEEAVWSGWTPVREVLECLEKTYGTSKSSAIGGIPPPAGPAASPWPTRSGAWSDNPCGRRCRDRSESQPPPSRHSARGASSVIPRGTKAHPPVILRAAKRSRRISPGGRPMGFRDCARNDGKGAASGIAARDSFGCIAGAPAW